MLRIVAGPSFPDLERGLIEEVRRLKAADPLSSLAIVVPSSPLLGYLRRRLVVDAGLPLLNTHVLTFYQLALRLADERRCVSAQQDPPAPLETVSDFFCEHLLANIVARLSGLEPLTRAGLAPGAAAALWATVRDLKDASVDPAVAVRALGEGHFEADDRPALQALFTLQAAVLESGRALSVGTPDDLTEATIAWAQHSPFLAGLKGIYYYGFYDLTQIQLAFFEAVVAATPATLYFPSDEGPSFRFARRFLDRHLAKVTLATSSVETAPAPAEVPTVSVMSAVGAEDELTIVCKEMLDLVETRGYAFRDIGVVGRSLTAYQPILRRLFDQHRIPLAGTAAAPAQQDPLVKTLLQLAWLPASGLTCRPVLELLCSPFYRADEESRGGKPGLAGEAHWWKLIVADLGITGQEEDWRRLTADPRSQDDGPFHAQRRVLERLAIGLIRDCRALPGQGGMASLTEAFIALAERHLVLPGLTDEGSDMEEGTEAPSSSMAAVLAVWEQLRQLDRLGLDLTWEEWARTFTRAVEQATVPLDAGSHEGVTVLDAMAARGFSFRALFVVGLNEKLFPRVIREDAFLRDRHRRVLAETLGYKIDEKLTGYDEEHLLFTLLRRSAGERLYLLYQRADDDGRVLAPSPYIEEARGAEPVFHLPRRFSERVGRPPFLPALLTRREWALYQAGEGQGMAMDLVPFMAAIGGESELFRNSVQALRGIEAEEAGLFDGLTGPLERYWDRLAAKGISPTSLEQYARCPFQYLAVQVLRLAPVRMTPSGGLSALTLGELCHATLNVAYPSLLKAGWPEASPDPEATRRLIRSAAAEAFAAHAARYGTGYPLLWDLALENVVELTVALVEEDRRNCLASGFRPMAFEVEAEGTLKGLGVGEFESMKVTGRLDRVDRRQEPPGWRIVDYKFKQGGEMTSQDRDLVTSALRGLRLQPPLYAMMKPKPHTQGDGVEGIRGEQSPEQVEFLFLAPRWEQIVNRSGFDLAAWQGPAGLQVKQTIARLLAGIRAGQYVMLPGAYCDHCDFAPACRRFHGPSEWRTYRADSSRDLRGLRKLKIDKADDAQA